VRVHLYILGAKHDHGVGQAAVGADDQVLGFELGLAGRILGGVDGGRGGRLAVEHDATGERAPIAVRSGGLGFLDGRVLVIGLIVCVIGPVVLVIGFVALIDGRRFGLIRCT